MTDEDFTGRDGYIVGTALEKAIRLLREKPGEAPYGDADTLIVDFKKALDTHAGTGYLAIKYEQRQPEQRQAWSDMQDMKAILLARYPLVAKELARIDEEDGRTPADLIDEKAIGDDPKAN